MHRPRSLTSWGLLLAALAAVLVGVARRRDPGELLPVIGGDTWPPVPVKDTRPA